MYKTYTRLIMEDQRIVVKIGGYPYKLIAKSPEHEELIRKAADKINDSINEYTRNYPDKSMREMISLTAINICIGEMIAKQKVNQLEKDLDRFDNEITSYLENIDKNSR